VHNLRPPHGQQVRRREVVGGDLIRSRDGDDGKGKQARGFSDGETNQQVVSQYKRFVTFYFTNFPSQLSNFYLRKGFEVYGLLEEVVVPSRRNVHGEYYGFVHFSKVRDVGKLSKVVNAVCFGNFRVRVRVVVLIVVVEEGKVARENEGKSELGKSSGDMVGVVLKQKDGEGESIVNAGVGGVGKKQLLR